MNITDFSLIFQSLPGNYIILLPDTPRFTIAAYNETRAKETFTGPEDLGKGIFEAFPDNPDDPLADGVAKLRYSLEKVLADKLPHEMALQKYDIPNADNSGFEERYWLPKNIPVISENNEVAYIIHYVRDMTAQVHAEKEMKEQKAFGKEMERQVDQRTRDLVTVNQELERSNKELEQFAYVTSHDLQEPLRKIQIYGGMLLDEAGLSTASLDYIAKIKSAAQRMSGLIRELLNYARLSRADGQLGVVDLNEILSGVLVDFELLINQTGAKIEAGHLPNITAIPLQIHQLFYNLVGNALKFSKKGSVPVIHISAQILSGEEIAARPSLDISRPYYRINFTDNGIGFEEAYAGKIFEIFQQVHQKTEYGGYGIGLTLCNRIVQNHKGLIEARSVPGLGATFTVVLPAG